MNSENWKVCLVSFKSKNKKHIKETTSHLVNTIQTWKLTKNIGTH